MAPNPAPEAAGYYWVKVLSSGPWAMGEWTGKLWRVGGVSFEHMMRIGDFVRRPPKPSADLQDDITDGMIEAGSRIFWQGQDRRPAERRPEEIRINDLVRDIYTAMRAAEEPAEPRPEGTVRVDLEPGFVYAIHAHGEPGKPAVLAEARNLGAVDQVSVIPKRPHDLPPWLRRVPKETPERIFEPTHVAITPDGFELGGIVHDAFLRGSDGALVGPGLREGIDPHPDAGKVQADGSIRLMDGSLATYGEVLVCDEEEAEKAEAAGWRRTTGFGPVPLVTRPSPNYRGSASKGFIFTEGREHRRIVIQESAPVDGADVYCNASGDILTHGGAYAPHGEVAVPSGAVMALLTMGWGLATDRTMKDEGWRVVRRSREQRSAYIASQIRVTGRDGLKGTHEP